MTRKEIGQGRFLGAGSLGEKQNGRQQAPGWVEARFRGVALESVARDPGDLSEATGSGFARSSTFDANRVPLAYAELTKQTD